ncbi:hypothetical protein ACAG26_08360 [Mycobacterium sp. pUA109]|uniref:hypothetical protein n=1 Tax=Mycobacterium sp. pUA109 TaxID=3238982 RepID=UPI00351B8FB0
MWLDWVFLGAVVCVLASWMLLRTDREAPRIHTFAKSLMLTGLSVVSAYVALFAAIWLIWPVYIPVARLFEEGPLQTAAVWLQAGLMFAVVAVLLRRNLVTGIPVLVFAAVAAGFGAWAVLHAWDWIPHPS